MARIQAGLIAIALMPAGAANAQCLPQNLEPQEFRFEAAPPAPLDLSLRPVVPECLLGLSEPERENCPRDEIAAFGAAVDAWFAALRAHVDDTNRFANEVAVFANSAIDYARAARVWADAALDFANCEAEAVTAHQRNRPPE